MTFCSSFSILVMILSFFLSLLSVCNDFCLARSCSFLYCSFYQHASPSPLPLPAYSTSSVHSLYCSDSLPIVISHFISLTNHNAWAYIFEIPLANEFSRSQCVVALWVSFRFRSVFFHKPQPSHQWRTLRTKAPAFPLNCCSPSCPMYLVLSTLRLSLISTCRFLRFEAEKALYHTIDTRLL